MTVSVDTKAKILRSIHLYLDNAMIATKDSKSGRQVFVLHPMFARDVGDLEQRLLDTVVRSLEDEAPAPKKVTTFEELDDLMASTKLGASFFTREGF